MSDELPTVTGEYNTKVKPVKRRTTRGTMYEDEFMFQEVHMDFNPNDVLPDDVKHIKTYGKLFYRYDGKPPVMVDEDGAYAHKGYPFSESQRQAYFVLSMLDAEGYVTGWRKK